MVLPRDLFQLQELDSRIEQEERALFDRTARLGNRQVLDEAQKRLDDAKERLARVGRERRDAEWQADDLRSRIAASEKQLYGGRVTNPKELASLQREVEIMKSRRDQIETRALELIEAVEKVEKEVATLNEEYRRLEEDWQQEQKRLNGEVERLKSSLAELKAKRKEIAARLDGNCLDLYERLRQQKKNAVVRVEQGICSACRIALSASLLQRARSGQLTQCGTCGRILFIP
ncbi:MAG: hypothetical protein N2506_04020 [Dehalococcoidales bacterium]|nr:hypothetical protein [Dehalococcoidales bacterium]